MQTVRLLEIAIEYLESYLINKGIT